MSAIEPASNETMSWSLWDYGKRCNEFQKVASCKTAFWARQEGIILYKQSHASWQHFLMADTLSYATASTGTNSHNRISLHSLLNFRLLPIYQDLYDTAYVQVPAPQHHYGPARHWAPGWVNARD